MLERLQRNVSLLGRSESTFSNYSRHLAAMALHFHCLPTELDPEQVKDYLYTLQKRSDTPSQSYFKHIRLRRTSFSFENRGTALRAPAPALDR